MNFICVLDPSTGYVWVTVLTFEVSTVATLVLVLDKTYKMLSPMAPFIKVSGIKMNVG